MHFSSLHSWFHCRFCYYLQCSSSLGQGVKQRVKKLSFCQNLFQLMYNNKPKSNAPLRKSHKTADLRFFFEKHGGRGGTTFTDGYRKRILRASSPVWPTLVMGLVVQHAGESRLPWRRRREEGYSRPTLRHMWEEEGCPEQGRFLPFSRYWYITVNSKKINGRKKRKKYWEPPLVIQMLLGCQFETFYF